MTVTLDTWDGLYISLAAVAAGIAVLVVCCLTGYKADWPVVPFFVLFFGGMLSTAIFWVILDTESFRGAERRKQEAKQAEQQQIDEAAPRLEAQGASDFALGLEYTQCPFEDGRRLHWQAGWRQAKRERSKKRGGL